MHKRHDVWCPRVRRGRFVSNLGLQADNAKKRGKDMAIKSIKSAKKNTQSSAKKISDSVVSSLRSVLPKASKARKAVRVSAVSAKPAARKRKPAVAATPARHGRSFAGKSIARSSRSRAA